MTYWVIDSAGIADGATIVDLPEEGPKAYKYDEGISLVEDFPSREDAVLLMDPDLPDRIKLYDFINNTDGVLIVNTKTKLLIESLQSKCIEFLPVTIWDHNRRPCSSDYFIVNALEAVPLIDMEKSDFTFGSITPDQIFSIENLSILPSEVGADSHLFRASKKRDLLFISDELKNLLQTENIKGYNVFDAQGWDGMPI